MFLFVFILGLFVPVAVVATWIALSVHGMRGLEYDPTSTPPGPREEWL